MTSTEIVPAPAASQEALVAADKFGTLRSYSLAALRDRIVPAGVPDGDVVAFSMLCTSAGANPFVKEACIIPFKEDGKQRGVPYLEIAYYRRLARESGKFDGLRVHPCDAQEKPLPKATNPDNVKCAVCEVHLKDQKLPVRVVVTLDEAKPSYSTPFWKGAKMVHQLMTRAECRALSYAFPPPVGLPTLSESAQAAVEQHEEQQARVLDVGEAVEGGEDIIEAEYEAQADVETIGTAGANRFLQDILAQFEGTDDERTALYQSLHDKLTELGVESIEGESGTNRLQRVPVDLEHELYAWAGLHGLALPPAAEPEAAPPTETDSEGNVGSPGTTQPLGKADAEQRAQLEASIKALLKGQGLPQETIDELIQEHGANLTTLRELQGQLLNAVRGATAKATEESGPEQGF